MRENKDAKLAWPPKAAQIFATHLPRALIFAFILVALGSSAPAQGQQRGEGVSKPGSVALAWQRSAEQEQGHEYLAAAQTLHPWALQYEQDYNLQLQVAWMYFQAGAYAEALPFYERADALASEIGLARSGKAWTLLKLGANQQAIAIFEEVLTNHEDATVRQGLDLARANAASAKAAPTGERVVWAAGSPIFQSFSDHPEKTSAAGVRVSLGLADALGLELSAVFAHTLYQGYSISEVMEGVGNDGGNGMNPDMGNGSSGAKQQKGREGIAGDFQGSEVYLHAGWNQTRWALHGQAAVTQEGAGTGLVDYGGAAGATMRLSWWHHLYLGASGVRVHRVNSTQANAAWAIAIGEKVRLIPSGKVMRVPGRKTLGVGGLMAALTLGKTTLWGSGRVGRGYHMVDFALPLLWNQEDDVLAGAAAGLDLVLSSKWMLSASAALEEYERNSFESSGLFFTAGLQYKGGILK